jgi:hypothetical protein
VLCRAAASRSRMVPYSDSAGLSLLPLASAWPRVRAGRTGRGRVRSEPRNRLGHRRLFRGSVTSGLPAARSCIGSGALARVLPLPGSGAWSRHYQTVCSSWSWG